MMVTTWYHAEVFSCVLSLLLYLLFGNVVLHLFNSCVPVPDVLLHHTNELQPQLTCRPVVCRREASGELPNVNRSSRHFILKWNISSNTKDKMVQQC